MKVKNVSPLGDLRVPALERYGMDTEVPFGETIEVPEELGLHHQPGNWEEVDEGAKSTKKSAPADHSETKGEH